jgi:hypothetical protein
VVVAAVPWARPGAQVTRAFEDSCAWLAAHTPFSVLTALLRVSWRTAATLPEPLGSSHHRGGGEYSPMFTVRRPPVWS